MSANTSQKPAGNIIHLDYQGVSVDFTGDGWFNATEAAEKFGKRIDHWLANAETKEYMDALAEALNTRNSGYLIKTKRGKDGGTWLHPKLAVRFAQWLDIRFAVWCDAQIDGLIRGKPQDWRKLRQEAATGYQFMSAVLQLTRQEAGKTTEPHHYINESRLINGTLSGQFSALDRESLSADELALLVQLEAQDAILLARGVIYQDRKQALERCAFDWRLNRSRALAKGAA